MEEKKVIPIYSSFYAAAKEMTREDAGAFFLAVCAAYLGEEVPELSGAAKVAYLMALPNIESSLKRADGQKRKKSQEVPENTESNSNEIPEKFGSNSEEIPSNFPSLLFTPREDNPSKLGDRVKGKGEDQRKVQWAENVSMTNEEHDKLVSAHGEADTARLIEILDNYKGSTGKRYKSDYRAILSWCVERLEEEKAKAPKGRNTFLDLDLEGL